MFDPNFETLHLPSVVVSSGVVGVGFGGVKSFVTGVASVTGVESTIDVELAFGVIGVELAETGDDDDDDDA